MSKDLLRNPTSRTPAILQKSGFAGKQDAIAGRRPGVRSVLTAATAEQLAAYGRVLERSATRVILTQSRQSTRSGQKAVWQVLDGCEYPASIQIVPNRETAIELAIRSAEPGEQVLLAGWGANRWTNDQTKELKNDMECAATALANMPVKLLERSAMTQSPRLRLFGGAA